MLEDKITLILITVAANLGLLVAGLIVMAIHQSRTIRVLKGIRTLEDRILARMLMEDRDREMIQGTTATLEDLIQMDLMEQMGQVEEMRADPNLTPATTEDLVKVLETRATSLQTTAKAGTTGKVAKTETPDRPRTIVAGTDMTDMETCDKHRRPIRVGDVLKVFHFTDARRKKHFMYKQVTRTQWLGGYGGRPKVLYFFVSHLSLKPESVNGDGGYWLGMHEGQLDDYEIVQCPTADHEEREKVEITQAEVAA